MNKLFKKENIILNKRFDNELIDFRLPKSISSGQEKENIRCPRCKIGIIEKISNTYYGFCNLCPNKSTYYCFWKPMLHQKIVLLNNDKWIFNFGAMGTGKTEASSFKIFRHLIEVKNAYIIVIANDLNTAKDMVKDVLFKFLPLEFIRKAEGQARLEKTQDKFTLINGSTLQIFSSQNPEAYRGRNATGAWVLEASKIKQEVVEELIGRIRNENQMIFAKDKDGNFIFEIDDKGMKRKKTLWEFGQIIIETNPEESSWIFKDGLLTCKKIFWSYHVGNGKGVQDYKNINIKKRSDRVAVISSTYDNIYVGNSFIKSMEEGTEQRKRKMLYGEFIIDGSQVWPNIKEREIKNANHDNSWPHLMFGDWGTTNDPVAFIYAFIDPYREKLIIWKAERIFQKSIEKVGYHLKKEFSERNYLYNKKIIDSAIKNRNPDYYVDGGMSVEQQLNKYPLNLGISLAKKNIKAGEIAAADLINNELIEFDTMGENVLELLEILNRAHYPKGNDTTKSGARKDIAKVVADNHWYDCFRYGAISTDAIWIREISAEWRNNHTFRDITQNDSNMIIGHHALNLNEPNIQQPRTQLGINYGAWLDYGEDDYD